MAKAKERTFEMRLADVATYLDSLGIDPHNVLLEGITDEGYWDRSGHNKQWTKWPGRDVGEKVIQLRYGNGPRDAG